MHRRWICSIVLITSCGIPASFAQGKVPWGRNVDAAIRQAQQSGQPLLLYVLDSSDDRNRFFERDQERVFSDPTVLGLTRRYIPVRVSPSANRDLLDRYGIERRAHMFALLVEPSGDLLEVLQPSDLRQETITRQKLASTLRRYRDKLFERDIKPLLESPATKPGQLRLALQKIDQFLILSADEAVIKLLDREDLDKTTRRGVYRLLAHLGTDRAVDALLDRVAADEAIEKALADSTPAAAEHMITTRDPGNPLWPLVYRTAGRICQVPNLKPDRYWETAPESQRSAEVQRVRRAVEDVSRRWREQYEDYR